MPQLSVCLSVCSRDIFYMIPFSDPGTLIFHSKEMWSCWWISWCWDTPVKFCLWCLTRHVMCRLRSVSDWRNLINWTLKYAGTCADTSTCYWQQQRWRGRRFSRLLVPVRLLTEVRLLAPPRGWASRTATSPVFHNARARPQVRATRAGPEPEPSRGHKSGNSPKKSIRNALKSLLRRGRARSAITFPPVISK